MPKQVKVCTVLAEADFLSTSQLVSKVVKDSSFFELRADYFKNLDKSMIFELKKMFSLPTIFTLRTKESGGKFIGDESRQVTLFQAAIDAKYEFVDLEVGSSLIKRLDKKSTKYLLSYHNFEGTPSYLELKKVVASAIKKGADIVKIATLVKNEEDLTVLANLLVSKSKSQKLIIIGMGEKGKPSRILFSYLGSFLTYVPSNNKIAPGQFTLKEMKKYVF